MYRWLGVALGLGMVLACAGPATPEPVPEPAPAEPEPEEPEEPEDPKASQDCRVGMMGVLVGIPGWNAPQKAQAPLKLRAQPRNDARVLLEFDREGDLSRVGGKTVCHWVYKKEKPSCVAVQFDSEEYGIPVYEVRQGWAQVSTGPGEPADISSTGCRKRTWVQVQRPLEVRKIEALLEGDKMTKTLPNWDGVLYDAPGGAPRPSGVQGSTAFRKGKLERVGDQLWIEATVIDTHCDTKTEGARGWLPLYDTDGALQVWYDSQC
jgi:hypothetical protein